MVEFKLEFFTPSRQIAHCGQATIAIFCYLSQLNWLAKQATSKEPFDARRETLMQGDAAYMRQLAPQYKQLSHQDEKDSLDALGIQSDELLA